MRSEAHRINNWQFVYEKPIEVNKEIIEGVKELQRTKS